MANLAKELLLKVKDGAVRGSIRLQEVEEVLSDDDFISGRGLLTTTEDGVCVVIQALHQWVGLVIDDMMHKQGVGLVIDDAQARGGACD
jgi:hypothetical protein